MTTAAVLSVRKALSRLAKGSVAKRLLADGVRGRRFKAAECPVSRWVRRETGREVCVSPAAVCVMDVGENVPVPARVASFVEKFDAGRFPELEEGKR